jgi:hypothetical protein
MKTAKFVKEITVIDPDSKGEVNLSVYKHEGGGMFAIDSSFLDQVVRTDDYDRPIISDPFNDVEDEAIEEVLLMDDSRPDALDNFIESVDLPQE